MQIAAIFLSAFVAAALAIPVDHVVHEKRDVVPFSKRSILDSDEVIPVRIALKQTNLDKGMDLLMDVSDPDSTNYGNHYTQEQVQALFAPSEESADTVKRWLIKAGIPAKSISSPKSQGWIDFETTVSKLESVLHTNYNVFHTRSGTEYLGTEQYHVPNDVTDHVDFVYPGVAMAPMKYTKAESPSMIAWSAPIPDHITHREAEDCSILVTPACIKQMYGIPDATSKLAGNELGVFEHNSELHKQSDLDKFYSLYATNIPAGFGPKINYIDYNGQQPDSSHAFGEAALDFDMAIPIIYPQGTVLYQTHTSLGTNGFQGLFNEFLDAVDGSYCTKDGGDDPKVDGKTPNELCGAFKPANVITFSYGLYESIWPASYLKRQCDEFMKLGLQGTSIVFASGDGGVSGNHGGACQGSNLDIFNPATPGSCPYVTSVGSTYLPKGSKPGNAEAATSSFASGGGFSNIWTAPDYQSSAVNAWFANHDPGYKTFNTTDGKIPTNGGIYNRIGRGFPDVAAVGDYGAYVFNGNATHGGGTSMSCPIFAAILTLLNEERLNAGKKTIGFANPAMYKNPSMFNDITIGEQSGIGTCSGKAFKTSTGWDPVTGLGTPKYAEMSKYFNSL